MASIKRYTIDGTTYIEHSPTERVIAQDRFWDNWEDRPIAGVPDGELGLQRSDGGIYNFNKALGDWVKVG